MKPKRNQPRYPRTARLNELLSPVQAKRAFAVFLAVVAVRLWMTAEAK